MTNIRMVAPAEPAFRDWHDSIRVAHLAGREPSWWPAVESARAYHAREPIRLRYFAIGAFEGDTCVGGAQVGLPMQRDTETMAVELGVLPTFRGRGVGTTLAAYVKDLARQHDRTIIQTEITVPAGRQLAETNGGRFARAAGMRSVSAEDRFVLDLPWDERRPAGMAQADGYRIVLFVDRVPDDYVAQWARLRTHMDQDVPTGELTRTPESIGIDRIREAERNFAEQGWTRLRTMAFTAASVGAGYTELYVSRYDDDFVVQDDTFVDRAHRGHRLGARMKRANLRQLACLDGPWKWVQTHTELNNVAMQRTNEALGFRRVDVLHEVEGRLR
ncbi:GNAT family N-acetyltransferase [Flexivirga caeni]|nr:GNAT family N-acetyltransferase [Flexivirga caeni]